MASAKRGYYTILGVDRNATLDQIKQAYRKRALETHPDQNASPSAEQIFKEVKAAYEELSDPYKRAEYDRNLARARHQRNAEFTRIMNQRLIWVDWEPSNFQTNSAHFYNIPKGQKREAILHIRVHPSVQHIYLRVKNNLPFGVTVSPEEFEPPIDLRVIVNTSSKFFNPPQGEQFSKHNFTIEFELVHEDE